MKELSLNKVIAIVVVAWLIVFVANPKPQGQRYRVISERNDTIECYDTESSWQGLAIVKNGRLIRIATEHK